MPREINNHGWWGSMGCPNKSMGQVGEYRGEQLVNTDWEEEKDGPTEWRGT